MKEIAGWAHAGRKFFDAQITAPELAQEELALIRQLYDVEREAQEWSAEIRYVLRQTEAVPQLH